MDTTTPTRHASTW